MHTSGICESVRVSPYKLPEFGCAMGMGTPILFEEPAEIGNYEKIFGVGRHYFLLCVRDCSGCRTDSFDFISYFDFNDFRNIEFHRQSERVEHDHPF